MRWTWLLVLLVLVLNAACAKHPPSPFGQGVEDCIGKNHSFNLRRTYHVVEKGETLYRISKSYGVSLEGIARTNDIQDPSQIKTGQRIIIPYYSALPEIIWPLRGRVSSLFGPRWGRLHTGVDIAAPEGTPIRAVADGLVVSSGNNLDGYSKYGEIVVLQHGDEIQTYYAHNRKNSVKAGECVKSGEEIAEVGASGNATGYHVHFEIRKNGRPVDPLEYLP